MRHRRSAQCGQVDALQRADRDRGGAGGELSVLHHRAERRRGGGAGSAAARACDLGEVRRDRADAADLRRHRGLGARRLEGRRAGQSVPRQYPRGRCHRARGALLRGPRRDPCGEPHRSERRHRDHRDRVDAGRSRQPRTSRRCAGEEGQGQRQGRQGGARDARSRQPFARAAARRQARPPGRAQAGRGEGHSTCSAC